MLNKQVKKAALLAVSAAVLGACASYTHVERDGAPQNGEIVWPNPEKVTFNKDRGTFPNVESLKEVRNGVTKDQLYYLLGRPHFAEGFGAREWDYLFHFNTPGQGTDGVTTCQYKILFDKDRFARNFYWRAVDPVDAVCPPPAPAPKPAPAPQPAAPQRFTLSADALFAFDRSTAGDMLPKGRAELDELAVKLRQIGRLDRVDVIGYTDFKGSDSYNQALSERRANTVRDYLVQRGIPASIVFAYGRGESNPVKVCDTKLPRNELIACLQPNRRVEVEVNGSSISQGNSMAY